MKRLVKSVVRMNLLFVNLVTEGLYVQSPCCDLKANEEGDQVLQGGKHSIYNLYTCWNPFSIQKSEQSCKIQNSDPTMLPSMLVGVLLRSRTKRMYMYTYIWKKKIYFEELAHEITETEIPQSAIFKLVTQESQGCNSAWVWRPEN